jgi:hypothetical protein
MTIRRWQLPLMLAVVLGVAAACSQPPASQQAPAAGQAPASAAQPAAPPAEPAAAPPAASNAAPGAAAQPRAADAPASPPPSTPAAQTPATTAKPATAAPPAAIPPAPVAAPKPEPPPEPKFREVTIPAGTALSVSVLSTLGSKTSQIEDPVRGALAEPVIVSGRTALPKGTEITGTVTDAKESARVKGKAMLAFRFDRLLFDGENHRIQTARVTIEAQQNKGDDVKKGGAGAGLGAIVGGIAGGGKGAAIGAVAGGTATVLATKGKEVEIPPGTVVSALLQSALTIRVPIK